jgi:transcriptional regulator with XRE-family HTH domain
MLVLAREHAGLTQVETARAAGVSQGLISRLEHGHHDPDDRLRSGLAALFDVLPCFFDDPTPLPEPVVDTSGASPRDLPMKPVRRAVAGAQVSRLVARRLLDPVGTSLGHLAPAPPGVTPADVAATTRAAWHLPPGPPEDLTALVESSGLPVATADLRRGEITSVVVPGDAACPTTIVLNARLPGADRRWALARALGRVLARGRESGADRWAAQFAAALLLPGHDVEADLRELDGRSALRLSLTWAVPAPMVVARARDAGCLSAPAARRIDRALRAVGAEQLDGPGERPSLLPGLVERLRRSGMTDDDLCELLMITPGGLDRILGSPGGDSLMVAPAPLSLERVPLMP